ncbi:F-box/LRR-repeat protein At2g43260 [Arabidopsis lyrata subsp. lyrata]|uniref:F-box/LRR-repeat protein At2g43260 n=1 Tax=Arabidopsis lyrata subsp. lyrata TaxID=81972 RepID=UPI000A29B3A1|nr:F-box/LRR-repeat protein At2g43260 [Arabidopsis lyrata subsp. lyrata]|eukprot:XP_002880046.2 F-box/LRR-repeat protein At2g43260 [Arabidopsis lyrata subsp. lyrata]
MLFGKNENPNLNADILEELFLRLPLKSLGRLKSVSKEWKSILESMWFVEKHLSLAKSSRKILLAYDCECGVSPSLLPGLRDFEWSQEFVYLHCDATRPSMSYEGFVCFPEAERVNVLNPSTGQLRRFHCPSLSNPRPKSSTFREESWTTYFPGYCAMGFGRDNVKGSYKVVRIFFDPTYCDILDVNTGKWRKLWKPRRCKVDVGRKSARVNGSIYWLRIRRGHVYAIVALDLHTEEFHDVPRPHLPKGIMFEAQIVNIRDRLAIAMPRYIWSMDGQKETWSKTHSISLASLGMVESRSFTPMTLSKQGDVLFYDDEDLLFKYISEKDKLQRLPEDICVISPSLR